MAAKQGVTRCTIYPVPVEFVAAAVLMMLVGIASVYPVARIPIGVLLAMYELAYDVDLITVVLIGAVSVTGARTALAIAARRRSDSSATPQQLAQAENMRSWLARSSTFGRTTFFAAAVPLIPGRALFALLGTARMPLRYAIAGCSLGQIPILALTTSIALWLATSIAASDQRALELLGVYAAILVVVRFMLGVDRSTWQSERRIRFDSNGDDARMQQWMRIPPADLDPDVIEGEIIREDPEDDTLETGPDRR